MRCTLPASSGRSRARTDGARTDGAGSRRSRSGPRASVRAVGGSATAGAGAGWYSPAVAAAAGSSLRGVAVAEVSYLWGVAAPTT